MYSAAAMLSQYYLLSRSIAGNCCKCSVHVKEHLVNNFMQAATSTLFIDPIVQCVEHVHTYIQYMQ